MSNSAGDLIDDFYAGQKLSKEEIDTLVETIVENAKEDEVLEVEDDIQDNVVNIEFGDGGNWEEHAPTLPLFCSLVANGLTSVTISEEVVNSLSDYTGRITQNDNETVTFEIFKKEAVVEVVVEEDN